MKVVKATLPIEGAFVLTADVFRDERGSFVPSWEECVFAPAGLQFQPESANVSYNLRQGTIRAFHYQTAPHEQSKLVSCISGRIWDVIVDLRETSSTWRQWAAVELLGGDGQSVYIPAGCAHGFATLEANSTVFYLIEGPYSASASAVFRWNDPSISVNWPIKDPIMSARDRNAPVLHQ